MAWRVLGPHTRVFGWGTTRSVPWGSTAVNLSPAMVWLLMQSKNIYYLTVIQGRINFVWLKLEISLIAGPMELCFSGNIPTALIIPCFGAIFMELKQHYPKYSEHI